MHTFAPAGLDPQASSGSYTVAKLCSAANVELSTSSSILNTKEKSPMNHREQHINSDSNMADCKKNEASKAPKFKHFSFPHQAQSET